ncbi:MAG: hypothetical protein PWP19_1606 [Thermococcaceae archaeon]|nr:hypothetical protein [Thermococcaceae archaeon]
MGLFSFGSKKNKIIKMLSEGELEKILHSAAKDPKYVDAMPYVEEGLPVTVLSLINDPDPYVKENAMQSFEAMLKYFPWVGEKFKNEMASLLIEILL